MPLQTIDVIGNLEANTTIIVPIKVEQKLRRRRNTAADSLCGLAMLYDFFCGGTRTRSLDVTLSRQQAGRPPLPCSGSSVEGVSASGGGSGGFTGKDMLVILIKGQM